MLPPSNQVVRIMRFISLFCGLLAIAASSPSFAKLSASERGQARLATALEGRVAGTPVNCISLRDIRSSEIIDRTAILYRTSGNRVFVNYPDGAAMLDRDDILVSRTYGSQLCNIDIVQLVDRSSRFPSGSVGLGKFVPYVLAPGAVTDRARKS